MILSILIPTLFTRKKVFNELTDKLMKQIKENNLEDKVEIIAHFDNKTIGLAKKRNNMLKTSSGKFITNLDDDDDIGETYIKDIVDTIIKNTDADLITFKQHCNCDGKQFHVDSDINRSIQGYWKNNILYRYPWIWCAWKRENFKEIYLEDIFKKKIYGEDRFLLEKLKKSERFKKEIKIDKILHYYRYNSKTTEC